MNSRPLIIYCLVIAGCQLPSSAAPDKEGLTAAPAENVAADDVRDTSGTAPMPKPETASDCTLAVHFASYGAGIDQATYARVEKLLVKKQPVSVEYSRWGREGEISLCIRLASPDAERLFDEIKDLFPNEPRGPLSIELAGGRSYEANSFRK